MGCEEGGRWFGGGGVGMVKWGLVVVGKEGRCGREGWLTTAG